MILYTNDIESVAVARYLACVVVAFWSGGEVVGYPLDREESRSRIEDDGEGLTMDSDRISPRPDIENQEEKVFRSRNK